MKPPKKCPYNLNPVKKDIFVCNLNSSMYAIKNVQIKLTKIFKNLKAR